MLNQTMTMHHSNHLYSREEELDNLIKKKEKELLLFSSRMENLRLDFAKETIDFAIEWYRKTVKTYIMKFPEITLNMKEERIHKMKTKVNELIKNADKIVYDELSNPELWWHQRPNLEDPVDLYTQVSDKYPEIVNRAVRHILGQLGVILEEFGYHVTTTASPGAYPEFWFDSQARFNPQTGRYSSAPYFPHLLKWSKEMQYTIVKYNAQFTLALQLFKETQTHKDEKQKIQANARWESI